VSSSRHMAKQQVLVHAAVPIAGVLTTASAAAGGLWTTLTGGCPLLLSGACG
jgi:hypothetical protein